MSNKIVTSYDRPPIPTKAFDWSAIRPNVYDGAEDSHPSCRLIGHGETESEAIADLLEQESVWEES